MIQVSELKSPIAISPRLTEKQTAVRDLLALGMTAKQVAVRLGISHRTVEMHREEIYRRMGVKCAVEMVRKMLSA